MLVSAERGGARLKFLLVILIIAITAYAAYLYVPVAYQAFLLRDRMQHDVDVAATQGYPPSWVHDQLVKSASEFDMPADAVILPAQKDNRVEVQVRFTRLIVFPGYTYEYQFDYTAKSTAFLSGK
jgi:hypothetical protein